MKKRKTIFHPDPQPGPKQVYLIDPGLFKLRKVARKGKRSHWTCESRTENGRFATTRLVRRCGAVVTIGKKRGQKP